MKLGEKLKYILCFLCFFGWMLVSDATAVCATTMPSEPPIEYTVNKVKDKIMMIPGEMRMVSTVIPGDSTFSSSNPKVALVSNSGQIIAKKAGTTKITHITGNVKNIYTVKVNDEVDLIVFAGQSNMCGSGGNAYEAPTPKYGTAYEFDLATGSKKTLLMKEPFGEGTNRTSGVGTMGYQKKSGTLVSAFCINYYKQTKVPVVGLSCAWGGSATNTWLSRGLLNKTVKNVKTAKKQLKKNKVKVRHIYMVWYQGESDAMNQTSPSTYISRMKKIYKKMKTVGVEKVFVIRIGHYTNYPERNYTIMGAQDKLCAKNKNFIMVSKSASKFIKNSGAYYSDVIHINQKGLNKIGYEAGKAAGKYAKKQSKKK